MAAIPKIQQPEFSGIAEEIVNAILEGRDDAAATDALDEGLGYALSGAVYQAALVDPNNTAAAHQALASLRAEVYRVVGQYAERQADKHLQGGSR